MKIAGNIDQREREIHMNIYIISVTYKSVKMKMIVTEDTDMSKLEKIGITVNEDDKKEDYGAYVARKKHERGIKRIQDKRHKKDKERKTSFSFEEFVMDYFE